MKTFYKNKSKEIYKNPLILNKRDNQNDFNNYKNYIGYNLIVIGRNPYYKLVSGFLDKYVNKIYENPKNCNNFEDFVNLLTISKNVVPRNINKAHFKLQTNGKGFELFNKIKDNNNVIIIDIKDINIVSKFINLKNLDLVARKRSVKKNTEIKSDNLWELNYEDIKDRKVNYNNFYNNDLKNKVYNYYKNDFIFFKDLKYD